MRADVAAENGSNWLDDAYREWLGAINLDKLDIGSVQHCVIGQLANYESFLGFIESAGYESFLGFIEATGQFGHVETFMIRHGFDAHFEGEGQPTYEDLTEAWIAEVHARRRHERTVG